MTLKYLGSAQGATRLQNHKKRLTCVDDNNLFSKNEKELKILIQTTRLYIQNIGKEFGVEKCAMIIMKSGKIKQQRE